MVSRTYITRVDTESTTFASSSNIINNFTTDITRTISAEIYKNSNEEKIKEKIKEFLKKELIKKMKETWNNFQKEIKISIQRPSIQLRGVCFGGRGWA